MRISNKIISEVGVQEKYIRDEHYNTLKVWWARRPVIAMRALLINEMLHGSSATSVDKALYTELNPSKKSFNDFAEQFKTSDKSVLDVFAGGGSIPFESSRLGFKTYASELNPVASLLQETIFNSLEIANYGDYLEASGYQVIERLTERYKHLYEFSGYEPYVLFWAKTCECKECGGKLELRRIRYFSKKANRTITLDGEPGGYSIGSSKYEREKSNGFICTTCGTLNSYTDIKDYCANNTFGDAPLAICHYEDKKKVYKTFTSETLKSLNEQSKFVQKELDKLKHLLPKERVQSKGGVINPTLYDLKYPGNYFNDRQRVILLGLIDELINQYEIDKKEHGDAIAKQILLGLTSLIEFQVDWNSKSTMWISQNEQTGRSLAGPGVGQKWDYIEVNPFFHMGSNFKSKLKRVVKTYRAIGAIGHVNIFNGSSASLPLEPESIDIILTDPPYFDSVDYTGLSEFFRPWFEVLLSNTFNKGIDLKNDISKEAIVELTNKKSKSHRSESHYAQVMTDVLKESNRVLAKDGAMLLLYSHKTFEGWKVIGDAITEAGLKIESCIPLEMERIARPRAMNYQALNGVIVFRMVKDERPIRTAIEDVENIHNLMEQGNLQESQLVIYLASLACKHSNLEGESFEESYETLIARYEDLRMNKWESIHLDEITQAFLGQKLSIGVSKEQSNLLKQYNLFNGKGVKQLTDIDVVSLPEDCTLKTAIDLFSQFEHNSKTRIEFDRPELLKLNLFFSVLGGLRLNTVKKRSSKSEEKVARLVLSKLNETDVF